MAIRRHTIHAADSAPAGRMSFNPLPLPAGTIALCHAAFCLWSREAPHNEPDNDAKALRKHPMPAYAGSG